MNLVVSQRHKVFRRSAERLNVGRCTYVVAGLASQENQWEWGLSRISEVIMSAPGHYWHSCYFCFGVEHLLHIVMRIWKEHKDFFRRRSLPSSYAHEYNNSCGNGSVWELIIHCWPFLFMQQHSEQSSWLWCSHRRWRWFLSHALRCQDTLSLSVTFDIWSSYFYGLKQIPARTITQKLASQGLLGILPVHAKHVLK